MRTSLLSCLALLTSPAFAGMPKLDLEALLPQDGTFVSRAVLPGLRAGSPALRAVPVHHLPKVGDRRSRLRAIGAAAVPATVRVVLVAPYQISRMCFGPGM